MIYVKYYKFESNLISDINMIIYEIELPLMSVSLIFFPTLILTGIEIIVIIIIICIQFELLNYFFIYNLFKTCRRLKIKLFLL